MTASKTLKRLLRVLDIEEEMRRMELASAQGELAQLESSLAAAGEREKSGRRLLVSSVHSADLDDRLAGIEEINAGRRCEPVLQKRIEQSALIVDTLHMAFHEKRVERKQAETLVNAAAANQAVEERRKSQQSLDQWFLAGLPDKKSKAKRGMRKSEESMPESSEVDTQT